jgi:Uma2 family endonuclease
VDDEKTRNMTAVLRSPDQTVVLRGVNWETYERLLADQEEASGPRLYYDCGTLEIMSPSDRHERTKDTLALAFQLIASEMGIDFVSTGSTTFRREDLKKGFEPDSCFYVRNAETVRAKDRIDFKVDPPPELVIEVVATNPVLNKLSLYSAAGVPEIWLCDEDRIEILGLDSTAYLPKVESSFLRGVTGRVLKEFVLSSREMKSTAWMKSVREWVAR